MNYAHKHFHISNLIKEKHTIKGWINRPFHLLDILREFRPRWNNILTGFFCLFSTYARNHSRWGDGGVICLPCDMFLSHCTLYKRVNLFFLHKHILVKIKCLSKKMNFSLLPYHVNECFYTKFSPTSFKFKYLFTLTMNEW